MGEYAYDFTGENALRQLQESLGPDKNGRWLIFWGAAAVASNMLPITLGSAHKRQHMGPSLALRHFWS